jgi:hypothetical protein
MDIGIIDSWLRGVSSLVPHGKGRIGDALRDMGVYSMQREGRRRTGPDFNRHTLNYGMYDLITHDDIKDTAGFRRLLRAAARNDVRIDLVDHGGGRLDALFSPDEPFLNSEIFGMRHISTLPKFFQERK